jgi:GMP synthase (glutamine-hydrolysing)
VKRKILVLQHLNWKGPGRFLLNVAGRLSIELHVVETWREPIPESSDFDALILLGGSLDGEQLETGTFFHEEKQFLQGWLALDKPSLGFCLGHQVLIDAFQAKVVDNFMNSVGFIEGYLTHDGREHPLFKGIEPTLSLFKWHRHAIQTSVQQNYILLATSSDCVVEAFTIKGRHHIIGLQCDNHAAHLDDICKWLESDKDLLSNVSSARTFGDKLLREAESSLKTNQEVFTKLIRNFISLAMDTKSVSGQVPGAHSNHLS